MSWKKELGVAARSHACDSSEWSHSIGPSNRGEDDCLWLPVSFSKNLYSFPSWKEPSSRVWRANEYGLDVWAMAFLGWFWSIQQAYYISFLFFSCLRLWLPCSISPCLCSVCSCGSIYSAKYPPRYKTVEGSVVAFQETICWCCVWRLCFPKSAVVYGKKNPNRLWGDFAFFLTFLWCSIAFVLHSRASAFVFLSVFFSYHSCSLSNPLTSLNPSPSFFSVLPSVTVHRSGPAVHLGELQHGSQQTKESLCKRHCLRPL